MSGITVVYVTFAIVIASVLGYVFLLSRREREIEMEYQDLQDSRSQRR